MTSILDTFHRRSQSVATVEADSARFLAKIETLLSKASGEWIFPTTQPTALDAHTIVYVARLLDTKRKDHIPKSVLDYAQPKLDAETWRGLLRGEPGVTMHSLYVLQPGNEEK
jgi:hypothetical protein